MARRRPARPCKPPLFGEGQAAGGGVLDRASRRHRADVLRLAAAQSGRGVDARADGHDEPEGGALHGRDPRLLSAGREPALEGPADDAPQAGPSVRVGRCPRDPEPGRPRLQGPRQYRDVVPRPFTDRTRQGPHARWARRRGGRLDGSGGDRIACSRRSTSACSSCTTSTNRHRWCSRPAGRCRTSGDRSRGTRSGC